MSSNQNTAAFQPETSFGLHVPGGHPENIRKVLFSTRRFWLIFRLGLFLRFDQIGHAGILKLEQTLVFTLSAKANQT